MLPTEKHLIAINNVVDDAGRIIIEKDKAYKCREIVMSEPFYGRATGQYYPPQITGYRLEGVYGSWRVDNFIEKN